MKWVDRGKSRNVQDRRAQRGPRVAGASLGIGGVILVLVFSLITGVDLSSILGMGGGGAPQAPVTQQSLDAEQELVSFVSFVLDDAQELWAGLFAQSGIDYREAELVLFRDSVSSACGSASSALGPFYCPLDGFAYIDLAFYDVLRERFGADGDFAQAYVLAHELGHHIQNLLGTMGQVQEQQRSAPARANQLSVALELQADCYAGIWASSAQARGLLERGDLEEGLRAAAAVGDDRLQAGTSGGVNPESFTHGSSQQRLNWFATGFESGDPNACNTFAG